MYALINLYTTVLKGSIHEAEALSIIKQKIQATMNKKVNEKQIKDLTDLYLYFIQSSPIESEMFAKLYNFAFEKLVLNQDFET